MSEQRDGISFWKIFMNKGTEQDMPGIENRSVGNTWWKDERGKWIGNHILEAFKLISSLIMWYDWWGNYHLKIKFSINPLL